jgi:hypothetical protein
MTDTVRHIVAVPVKIPLDLFPLEFRNRHA